MIFIQLYQFLGDHVPALGAFLTSCLIFGLGWFVAYRLGRRAANKAWKWDVEHNAAMLKQDIRENYEKRIVELETRNKYLEARHDAVVPALKQIAEANTVMAEHFAKEAHG